MTRYLSERCLCLFGYIQRISRPIPVVPFKGIDKWFIYNIISNVISIRDNAFEVQLLGQFDDSH